MFDRPARPFRRAGLVQEAGDDIESPPAGSTGDGGILGQPGVGAASQATLLAFVDGLGRQPMISRSPTLDFDEDEEPAPPSDQVDLDPIRADVARDDAIPSGFEEAGGMGFALTSEDLTVIHHRSTRVGDGNAPHRGDTDR